MSNLIEKIALKRMPTKNLEDKLSLLNIFPRNYTINKEYADLLRIHGIIVCAFRLSLF